MYNLAPSNRLLGLIASIIFDIVFIIISISILSKNFHNKELLVLIFFFVLLIFINYKSIKKPNIHYNDEFLILLYIGKKKNIPLKNLRKTTLTLGKLSVFGINLSQYRIEYNDENGAKKSVKFWNPMGETDSLKEFQKVVRKHKSGFKVKFFASTFDQ